MTAGRTWAQQAVTHARDHSRSRPEPPETEYFRRGAWKCTRGYKEVDILVVQLLRRRPPGQTAITPRGRATENCR